ncbi:hypothetical protein NC797_10745 [Aquibacillus sp. 3ASR75-11]|uniref:Uncharacterized protein n=1 Tax=Terrihalobacillus insolitus TaxID=2950438 RepID=A0A9X3WSF3_9BACI|nr:hypothetical protein [Terrihalobacillus insolitus]MDC3413399.1 hypothetical protein [Terrihalobacillus insolitus]MDC3424982.1 hypothetical protein [Terrihalobacillus insolitus]
MKKRYDLFHNQNGFLFPYVLFVMILILIFVSSNVAIYKNTVMYSDFYKEQLKIDTLVQMSTAKFKEEIVSTLPSSEGDRLYTFPDGTVQIYYQMQQEKIIASFSAVTDENASFITTQTFSSP